MGIKQKQIIGILGGLGPFAHIELEKRLLEVACEYLNPSKDQDFPQWILSSMPQTPDRTLALKGMTASPVPALVQSLQKLETHIDENGEKIRRADFIIIACNTAHKFLPEIIKVVKTPILNMVEETARFIARFYPGARVGILATTGTLESGIYHTALEKFNLTPVSPLDLAKGIEGMVMQRVLVMEPIYGFWNGIRNIGESIKSVGPQVQHTLALEKGAETLINFGKVDVIISGCTEIPLALTNSEVLGKPIIDTLRVIAMEAIRRAYDISPSEWLKNYE